MSLQLWLPLNGNLNNNGLSGISVEGSPSSWSTDGKLGKCATFNGSTSYILYNSTTSFNYTDNFSFCMWLNHKYNSSAGGQQYVFTVGRADMGGYGYSVKSLSASALTFTFGNRFIDLACPVNEWHHIAFTVSGTIIKIYKDGILAVTSTTASLPTYSDGGGLGIGCFRYGGGNIYPFYGNINDFRIYDHCLSTKEVKEISKGLVLHYKLTGHGSDNLFVDSHFDSRYQVTAWDTSKNGSYCASNWGGYNGGVGNPSTVYHAHLELKDNEYVYNYTKDANNSWLGISPSIGSYISAGSTYTFSCEVLRISGTNYPNGGIHTKASSTATSWSFVTWYDFSAFSSIPADGKWHKYASTMTVPSGTDLSGGASFYIYGHSGGNGTFLMRHPKLEAGSVSTSWCVRSSDGIYSTLSANRSVEYDLSGNKYNGTKSGNISALDSSPRYNSCTYMRASDAKIRTTLTTSGFANSFTISWWSNISDMSGKMAWGFSDGNRLNVFPSRYFCWNTGDSENNPFKNNGTGVSYSPYNGAWHHYAVTGNGSTNILYIDGKEVGRSTTYKGITGSTIYISGWDSGTSYAWSGGSISDFRIYSTVLSASDIKELYNSPIKISKNGTMMCSEIEELP